MNASSGRYPLMFGATLRQQPHQRLSSLTGPKTAPTDVQRGVQPSYGVYRIDNAAEVSNGQNQSTRKTNSRRAPGQSEPGSTAPTKVNFYGGRPHQRRSKPPGPPPGNHAQRNLRKSENKKLPSKINSRKNRTKDQHISDAKAEVSGAEPFQGHSQRKEVLQHANDRVNLVKELIREEAGPILSSVSVPPGSKIQTGRGEVNPGGVAVDPKTGAFTINLYVNPKDIQTDDGQAGNVATHPYHNSPLISGNDLQVYKRPNPGGHVNNPAPLHDTNKGTGSQPSPAKQGSIVDSRLTTKPHAGSPHGGPDTFIQGNNRDKNSLLSLPSKQIPVERRPVHADIPPPRAPSRLSNLEQGTISIDEPSPRSPMKRDPSLQQPSTDQTLQGSAHNKHRLGNNGNYRRAHDHLATGADDLHTRHAADRKVVTKFKDSLDSDNSVNGGHDYFGENEFSSRLQWVDTPIEELLDPHSDVAMERRHEHKYYPRPVDSRAQFEQRLEDEMQHDLSRGGKSNPGANNMGKQAQDNLKDLSAKHYLINKNRLDSRTSSQGGRYVEEPSNVRNVTTNTGTVQYVLRNKHRGNSSSSSVSTIPLDHPRPNLPQIHAHGAKRARTKRVKESEAQTDHNDDLSEFDDPVPPTQEIAVQTYKLPRDVANEKSLEPEKSAVEIGIQTFDAPREVSTQTLDEPKTVSTSTDDLRPPTPTPRKTVPRSPMPPLYRGQTLYREVRDIIEEESDPNNPPAKKDPSSLGVRFKDQAEPQEVKDDEELVLEEEETFVLYMQTDHGAILGPFKLEIDDIQYGLPHPTDSNDQVDTSRYESVPGTPPGGLRNRQTGTNSINEHSSRSHSMLTVNIDSETQDPDDENVYITKHGKLTFVDLAGSEKTKTDMVTSQEHLLESNNINRSLLVLGNCISALSDSKKKNGHIPYRDSKLTKLLADSLGGNGVTLMIACVSPSSSNSGETMNTLRYANRAKKIKTKPVIKMDPRERLIVSLKREIKILRQENHYLRQQLEFPVKPKGQLQKENDQKFLQMLRDYKKDGKISDHGLYDMLQEYMVENETLRSENTDLHQLKDQGRRDQQTLARENERLLRKLDILEKERMLVNTPMSVYSVGSTVSRRSSGADSQFDQTPPNWQQGGGPNQYNKDSQRGAKRTPPSHLQHPSRPPHRLPEPVNKNNPGYFDSPRPNGYTNRYNNQLDYYRNNQQGGSTPHQGASYPHAHPSNNNPQYSKGGPQAGNPRGGKKPGASQEAQPVAAPRRSQGAPQGSWGQQGYPPQHSVSHTDDEDHADTESIAELNDRLRQELLDLEGQIKKQGRLSQNPTNHNTRR